ncbi:MAG TPA: plastocyanin/azurin family copper-binding protein [Candidatus Eisenbacteria bacterium]|nr:plastocyanin/azurin family copper-binding protein [Candidatus Eisenbacteria bacterium]
MKRRRGTRIALTLLVLAVAGLALSCGSDPAPNAPPVVRELDSGNINGGGGTFAHTFPMTQPATYGYHCTIHGTGMAGSVHVQTGHPATAAVTITDNQYSPSTALVAPGGTVTWTNNGSTHTVTSN